MWLGAPYVIDQIVTFQAKMIGGSKYFAHLDMAPGVATQYSLAGAAVLICALLWASLFFERSLPGLRSIVRVLAFPCAAVAAYVYLPVLMPPLSPFAFFRLAVFPPEYQWFPACLVVLAILTGLTCESSPSSAQGAAAPKEDP